MMPQFINDHDRRTDGERDHETPHQDRDHGMPLQLP
jgi:hypothetical protein